MTKTPKPRIDTNEYYRACAYAGESIETTKTRLKIKRKATKRKSIALSITK